MNIKCMAVDDEPFAIEKLKSFIEKIPHLSLAATFSNPSGALEFMKSNEIQLIFLDIQMGEISGIEMIERMKNKPQIIFTTAYNEYALKAFELSVTDYLLKPFTFDRFRQAIGKATDYIDWQNVASHSMVPDINYFFVKSGYKLVKIFLSDILYIEGMRDFQSVMTTSARILVNQSFQELEKLLPKSFIRCHKSYIVSLPKIESIEKDRIRIGSKLIPVGETFRDNFYKSLQKII
jgi:two-component system, LytTR family, response regulator